MSLTVSLIAVLIPLLFMGDIVGRLFREFAITLSVTILISALVSLTLTPMMCARLLQHKPESEQGSLYRFSERMFQGIIAFYGKTLQWCCAFSRSRCWSRPARWLATICLFIDHSQRIFPGSGYGRHSRHFRSAADDLLPRHGRTAAGAGAR